MAMKNLFIISFLVLALSSCIKVESVGTECVAQIDPQLTASNYNIYAYGTTVRLGLTNFYSGKQFVVVTPKGDSLVYDHYSDSYIDIPVTNTLDTGTYYIFTRDYSHKCKSNNVYFNITSSTSVNCALTVDNFTLSPNNSSYTTGLAPGQAYSAYYSISWYTGYGTLNTKLGTQYTGTASKGYNITQTTPNNMGDSQCIVVFSTSVYTYTAIGGQVVVNYNAANGNYDLKLCNITWQRDDNNYVYGGKAWVRYYQ